MSSRLPNYLRAARKRSALSQDEVAFLLGTHGGAKVCRYERFVREPSLENALALEIIFQTPIRELFAGLARKVEERIAPRAKALQYKTSRQRVTQEDIRRHESVSKIVAALSATASKS